MIRRAVRRLLNAAVPQWSLVALEYSQDIVSVTLQVGRDTLDLTRHHAIVCLRPLILAVHLPDAVRHGTASGQSMRLLFTERETGVLLGHLDLGALRHPPASFPGPPLQMFAVTGVANRTLPANRVWPHQAYMWWQMMRSPATLRVSARDLRGLQVGYVCPRPVGLVTVPLGQHENCFPFDLMAPLGEHFAFGLRVDRKSSAQVSRARRIAVSLVPAHLAADARALGRQHKSARVEWDAVPFTRDRSPQWGLPVPSDALEVMEVEVTGEAVLGSHAVFTGAVVSRRTGSRAAGMFTVSGLYAESRRLRGRALTALS